MSHFDSNQVGDLPGPDWLRRRRLAALERFADDELPDTEPEIWRYSRIEDLDLDDFPTVGAAVAPAGGIPRAVKPLLDELGPAAAVVVVRNGRLVQVDVPDDLAGRIAVGPVTLVDDAEATVGSVLPTGADVFADLHDALVGEPVLVRVPAGEVVAQPIVVVHWADAEGAVTCPRTIVQVGSDAEATVVELHASAPGTRLLSVPASEVDVASAGRCRHVVVQDLAPSAWQLGHQHSRVEGDATLRSLNAVLGGDYARTRIDSRLVGRGADGELLALYFAEQHQMHDFRTFQKHAARDTRSELVFKGAVQDDADAVYTGMIRIDPEATGSDAHQTNRNLKLSERAWALSVPNLDIQNNDVRCSHATTVGPVDVDQLFYLTARGVPPEVAERLVVMGFFREILARVPLEGLRRWLEHRVGERFERREEPSPAAEVV